MSRPFRTVAALIAAYSIALQALLAGFVLAAHAGFDPAAIICVSDDSNGHSGPLQPRDHHAGACLAACTGAAPAVTPPDAAPLPREGGDFVLLAPSWAEELPGPAKHRPQASRAPPVRV